jgi:lipid-binding SYLF domain-containing protein
MSSNAKVGLLVVVCLVFTISVSAGNEEELERLGECAKVAKEVLDIPEGLPQDLLDKAECVLVIPSVKKFALGFGGSYGKGAMICRKGSDFKGPWGTPAMYRLEGGSIGFQIGGSATDFILLVMNPDGVKSLLSSKVKLGADAMAAAGPKGRSAEAATDAYMEAEILTYSRSKGLFAGVSLKGSTLRQDSGANKDLFGKDLEAREIILESKAAAPAAAKPLIDTLQKRSPKNRSK